MNTKLTKGLAAVFGAASLMLAAGAAQADDGPAAPAAPAQAATSSGTKAGLKTLAQAVRAGRVDARLVSRLRKQGRVDAIVTFEQQSILSGAQATAAVAPGARAGNGVFVRNAIDAVVPALASVKRQALRNVRREVKLVEDLRHIGLSYVRIQSERGLLRLVNSRGVSGVRANDVLKPQLAQSLGLIRQPTAVAAGNRGDGTYVAVLDTGVNYRHGEFGCTSPGVPATCRVAYAWDEGSQDNSLDDNGHGSNVSGIVAGVAPGAKIINVDIFPGKTTGDWYAARAIERLVTLQRTLKTIAAINLSVGSDNTWIETACNSGEYETAFASARFAGMIPVVSAGNHAHDVNGGFHVGLSSPACSKSALTVGAVYDSNVGSGWGWGKGNVNGARCWDQTTGPDRITCFSQTGRNLDMLAPGACIVAGGGGGTCQGGQGGTSQAAPHVAGALAVLKAARPSATIDQLENAVVSSGPEITDHRTSATHLKRHRLDLPAALQTLLSGTGGGTSTDVTPPTLTAPTQKVAYLWGLGGTAVPTTISWSGSDASGIARYAVKVSRNYGTWTDVTLPTVAATSTTLDLEPGSSYQFIVAAQDGAGNWSTSWTMGTTFKVQAIQETSTAVTYTGAWTSHAWSPAYGGSLKLAAKRYANARLTFNGRHVALVAPRSPSTGQAWIYVDGKYVGYIDTYQAENDSNPRRVVLARDVGPGNHTLDVQVVGTDGRSNVYVDAFIVLQ